MRRLIIIIICLVVGLLVVVGVIALIGAGLPKAHVATRSVRIGRPRQEVYAVVRDFASAPSWRSDVQRVEMLTLAGGKGGFREHGKHGSVTYELSEDVPNERMVTRIMDTNLGYSGNWTYTFADEAGGTRVTITENGEVSNVIFRFMSRYMFGHTATIDLYLTSLSKRLERPESSK